MDDEGNARVVPLRPVDDDGAEGPGDDELMLLLRGGRNDAFARLVERYQQQALRTAGKLLSRPDLAKDAVQNAFLQVFTNRHRYRAEGKFRPFFFRVLLNCCKMIRRKRRRLASLAPHTEIEDTSGWPDQRLIERERMLEVDAAVRRLSPKLRRVVVLRYASGLSIQEIARTLDLPEGTVKSRLFAGMDRLRKLVRGGSG